MSALGWIILAICVIALVVVLVIFVRGAGQHGGSTRALRRRFGPEYDRAVEQSGDQQEAKRRLAEIARRRDELDIRPLDADERASYVARWDGLQAQFVDEPAEATQQADLLIADVMRTRGYPEADFDGRAELISADRPEVVSSYRQAHAGASSQVDGQGTEKLRSAFIHYRELFEWLVEDGSRGAKTPGRDPSPALSGPDRSRA
ncbi:MULTISPECIES: hypothetical protein [Pseudofrankia]|uniref:hypothetical protein n=1 Tax=Pseudofrankia TaxID=2994363 RepID=UPI000234D2CA|nr:MULTISPECIES: hypothetical protein [Pseudofrankia]OHV33332.1 hypothetical protein BCD49_27025 [Pseudofrankia sp. EUN1h]